MTPVLEESITLDFIVSSSTGAAADADSTPTVEVFEDATDTAILAPTATKRTSKTGDYRIPVACTAANGFEVGKSYNVIVSATVGGVAAKAVVARFQVRAASADSVYTRIGAPAGASLAADVQTRLSAAAYLASLLGFPVAAGSTATVVALTVPSGTVATGWAGRKLYHVPSGAEATISSASASGTAATVNLGSGWPTPNAGEIAVVLP